MVDVVIVNWNSGEYLSKCIRSLLSKSNQVFIGQIFIIDNNSSDNSIALLPSHPKILITKNDVNNGFAKACNQGFLLAKEKYTLLLNPDTQVLDETLSECASFMDENDSIDILGVSLLDDDGKVTYSCARFPSPLRYFYDASGLSKISKKIFHPAILMTDWDHKQSKKVDQVMGAFMFIRNSVFKKIGYFDERFFVYYEELDFSKRLAEAGGISYYNSGIKAVHSGAGSTSKVKAFRLYLNLQSRLKYARKHFSLPGYCVVWFGTFFIEILTRNIFLLLSGDFKEVKNVFSAYALLIRNKDDLF